MSETTTPALPRAGFLLSPRSASRTQAAIIQPWPRAKEEASPLLCKARVMFSLFKWLPLFRPATTPTEPLDWLVIGLGNPGARYATTRHNVGYLAVDQLLDDQRLEPIPGVPVRMATITIGQQLVGVLRSTTYMNESGLALAPLARKYDIPVERIIVVHDELDIAAEQVKIRVGGNENGHNGLKSCSEQVGSRDYIRVRIGIGRPPKGSSISDWVLSPMSDDAGMAAALIRAAAAVRLIIEEGVASAQNRIHSKK